MRINGTFPAPRLDCLETSPGPHRSPAESPDLNVIEDLRSNLNRKAKAAKIATVVDSDRNFMKLIPAWTEMSWRVVRKSVESMRTRLAECEKLQGGRTHH